MRIAIASQFGCGAGLWRRFVDEGSDVKVWIAPPEQKRVGDGIVPKAGQWDDLLSWAKVAHVSGEPTLVLFDSTGLGEKADQARKWGLHVIGGGSFCDRLEKDRTFGFDIAKQTGAKLPPYEEFPNFSAAKERATTLDSPLFWKSDRYLESDATQGADDGAEMAEYLEDVIRRFGARGSCILQQKIEGIAVSTAAWWNGRAFVGGFATTIEHKKAWNDDLGPSTGCSFNAVWLTPESDIAAGLGWERLAPLFLKHDAPPGLYDMNAVVDGEGTPFFLEWTPRFGWDSEPASTRLWPNLSQHLWNIATGQALDEPSDEIAYSVRLSVSPYPWEHAKRTTEHGAMGTVIRGDLGDLWSGDFIGYELELDPERGCVVASPEGIVGLAFAQGDTLSELGEQTIDTAHDLRPKSLQYRSDGSEDICEDAEALDAAGIDVHPGLLE